MNQIEVDTLKLLRKIGKDVAKRFKFEFTSVSRLSESHVDYEDVLGLCDEKDKLRIRLRNLDGVIYPIKSLIRTLTHELAHVGQPDDEPVHGNKWKWRYLKYKKYVQSKWGDVGA